MMSPIQIWINNPKFLWVWHAAWMDLQWDGSREARPHKGYKLELNIDQKSINQPWDSASGTFSPPKCPFADTAPAEAKGSPCRWGGSAAAAAWGTASGAELGLSWQIPDTRIQDELNIRSKSHLQSSGNGRNSWHWWFVWQSHFQVTFGSSAHPSFETQRGKKRWNVFEEQSRGTGLHVLNFASSLRRENPQKNPFPPAGFPPGTWGVPATLAHLSSGTELQEGGWGGAANPSIPKKSHKSAVALPWVIPDPVVDGLRGLGRGWMGWSPPHPHPCPTHCWELDTKAKGRDFL